MKTIIAIVGCLMMFSSQGFAQMGSETSFAVVELFASEGCSSCPPADTVLQNLAKEQLLQDQSLYLLTFEIDYWDSLGWKDPYGDPAFSRRQQEYAAIHGSDVYTPQMVVNGQDYFVGSDSAKAKTVIAKYLREPSFVKITASAVASATEITITYQLSQSAPNAVIHFALVEHQATSYPTRGENAGATLRHINVVRAFKTVKANPSGKGVFPRPKDKDSGRFSVIVYNQSLENSKILAASTVDLVDKITNEAI